MSVRSTIKRERDPSLRPDDSVRESTTHRLPANNTRSNRCSTTDNATSTVLTPATGYQTRPKATPAADRTGDHHDRVRHDRVDDTGVVTLRINGRLHHIGIGRTHARTHVILLVHDLHVRIVDATTGELYRELIIDPNRDYQPTGKPSGPTRPPK
jgi:hypothetical protein